METTRQNKLAKVLNVPNVLTMSRLILAIVVFALIPLGQYLAALIVFVVAASTDWVDGYWARRYNQVTQVGRIFDPFVDKILVCGVFILLGAEKGSGITAWMAVVVVGREMLVTALRGFIEQSGGDFSAKMAGKLKMVFQCAAIIGSLLTLTYGVEQAPNWFHWTLPLLVWVAVLSTIYSGLEYVVIAAKYVLAQPEEK